MLSLIAIAAGITAVTAAPTCGRAPADDIAPSPSATPATPLPVPASFNLCAAYPDGTSQSVIPYHEGAGINYAHIGGSPAAGTSFNINEGQSLEYQYGGQFPYYALLTPLTSGLSVLEIGVLGLPGVNALQGGYSIQDGALAANGSTSWAACHDIGDVYHYAGDFVALIGDSVPVNCTPVAIKVC